MDTATRRHRRGTLRSAIDGGVILMLGNVESPRVYPDNAYPFRQDSSFLYYVGTDLAGVAFASLPDGQEILFGTPAHPDDLVWHGPHATLEDHALAAGVDVAADIDTLPDRVAEWRAHGLQIHYLPPYRGETTIRLAQLLGLTPAQVDAGASRELVRAVVAMRSIKTAKEITQIEKALAISHEMYRVAMGLTKPGLREAEVAGAMQGVALAHDAAQSFLPIVSIRGEVLHNTSYANVMEDGDLLLIDSGTESPHYYASDITRTIPVSGRFTPRQRDVYQVVLASQLAAIEAASPRVSNRDLHLVAAKTIAGGLKDMGLMKGDVDDAVEAGAHALFFVHGLGHMLGLDVHDMEDLGDTVGYPEGMARSSQFGLSFLRLAKQLEPGFVITIEPGVYFVPALIDRWREEGKHTDFIDYDAVESFRDFGGIRIEDDLLITDDGSRVLGEPIPKSIEEVEAAMAR